MTANNPHYPLEDCETEANLNLANPHMAISPEYISREPPKCVLFGRKFCLNISTTFHIREKMRMNRDNCFKVYDSTNQEFFKVSNPLKTMRGKHVLSDIHGEELVKMKKKLLSLHPTWHLNAGPKLESRLATLVFEFTLLKKKGHVYVYSPPHPHEDDDTKYEHLRPTLLIKSDTTGRDFKVFDEVTGEVFSEISKKHHGTQELLMETDDYTVTVSPGVDVLFMITLALMYEYALSDIES